MIASGGVGADDHVHLLVDEVGAERRPGVADEPVGVGLVVGDRDDLQLRPEPNREGPAVGIAAM